MKHLLCSVLLVYGSVLGRAGTLPSVNGTDSLQKNTILVFPLLLFPKLSYLHELDHRHGLQAGVTARIYSNSSDALSNSGVKTTWFLEKDFGRKPEKRFTFYWRNGGIIGYYDSKFLYSSSYSEGFERQQFFAFGFYSGLGFRKVFLKGFTINYTIMGLNLHPLPSSVPRTKVIDGHEAGLQLWGSKDDLLGWFTQYGGWRNLIAPGYLIELPQFMLGYNF